MKKTAFVVAAMLCALVIVAVSCYKTSEDQLAPPPSPTGCDTANSTYSADVVPILQANCYSCHGNGESDGGVHLDSYNNVKDEAEEGALLGTITHASGYPPMPQGGAQLSDCDINTIKDWIDNGMQNN